METKEQLRAEIARLKAEVKELSFIDDYQRQEIARLRNLLEINFKLDDIREQQDAWFQAMER